ncbi:MAG: hypothetical protein ACI8RD_010218, partial [Bacillariaceae sp.]
VFKTIRILFFKIRSFYALSREEIAYVGNHAVCKLQPNKKCDTQLLLLKTLSALQQTKHKNQSSSYKRKEKKAK